MGKASSILFTKGESPGAAPSGQERLYKDINGVLKTVDENNSERIVGQEGTQIPTLEELSNVNISGAEVGWILTRGEDGKYVLSPPLPGPKGDTGDTGPQGLTGPQGAIGPQGPQGLPGIKGDTGERGPQGDVGPQGPQGTQGIKGDTGVKGDKGDIGLTGPQGPQGNIGPTGPAGSQGIQGIQGPKGDPGTQGPQGVIGPIGPQGSTGEGFHIDESNDITESKITSIQNTSGATPLNIYCILVKSDSRADKSLPINSLLTGHLISWDGSSWYDFGQLTGVKGDIGPQGPQGLTGPQGVKGDTGDTGAQGPQGLTGPQGPIGVQGIQGIKGDKGDKGDPGLKGDPGPQGLTGPQGPIGNTGERGPQGDVGSVGPTGPKGDKGDPGESSGLSPSSIFYAKNSYTHSHTTQSIITVNWHEVLKHLGNTSLLSWGINFPDYIVCNYTGLLKLSSSINMITNEGTTNITINGYVTKNGSKTGLAHFSAFALLQNKNSGNRGTISIPIGFIDVVPNDKIRVHVWLSRGDTTLGDVANVSTINEESSIFLETFPS